LIDFLYNIIIFPLVQIIEITFVIIDRIFNDKVLAIAGVSAAVTVCTLPLYFIAEKWQQSERDIQKRLKPKISRIKSIFKGDEQYMILSAYYRQNNYHPIYALRSSLGILIQVPFFIAAYSWLSNLEYIKGVSFLFIRDLSAPDRFTSIGGFYLNLLPILMTLINCTSAAVYTQGLAQREKIQSYGMAAVFIILLYNSPSGLVLYWTLNNVFSLIKNILSKTGHGKKIIYGFLCLGSVLVDIHLVRMGISPKRLFVAGLCSLIFFAPLFKKIFNSLKKKFLANTNADKTVIAQNSTFFLSAIILFLLSGLVIPGSLIASSVQEFSFLESYTSPMPFLYITAVQSAGIFLLWPFCVYFLYPKKTKYVLTLILSLLSVIALINVFLFPGDYGFLTTTFKFSNPDTFESKYMIILISSFITLALLFLGILSLLTRRKIIFHSFQAITVIALVVFGLVNTHKINTDFKSFESLKKNPGIASAADTVQPEPVYHFSKNGKNIIIIMLDAAISGYIPYIFNEKPQLLEDFSGFIYYPNCASFGLHSRIGVPLLFGGYEYEPRLIQKNRSFAMEKHNEALLMMPRIFSEKFFHVTVTDPTFANYSLMPDLSIFAPYPEITALNIQGRYTGMYLRSHPELDIVSIPKLLKELLTRFSFLKIASPAFRIFIYDKANWLKPGGNLSQNQLSLNTLDWYVALDYLPHLTDISDDDFNTYTAIVNEVTHDTALFQYPGYIPVMNITDKGYGPFADEKDYHSNMAALLLLGKWFKFLQEQGVYGNARIIITSDHGKGTASKYYGNILLPSGEYLAGYHAPLLVKDFDSHGDFSTNMDFMTNADVPCIAMAGLVEEPQNPFSGKLIKTNKENGIIVSTSNALQFVIAEDQWLYVHDDIFIPDNWEKAKK
jgi:YidC/Oxa1 family membrane protein insertase